MSFSAPVFVTSKMLFVTQLIEMESDLRKTSESLRNGLSSARFHHMVMQSIEEQFDAFDFNQTVLAPVPDFLIFITGTFGSHCWRFRCFQCQLVLNSRILN
jgi:hypothetical protein